MKNQIRNIVNEFAKLWKKVAGEKKDFENSWSWSWEKKGYCVILFFLENLTFIVVSLHHFCSCFLLDLHQAPLPVDKTENVSFYFGFHDFCSVDFVCLFVFLDFSLFFHASLNFSILVVLLTGTTLQ